MVFTDEYSMPLLKKYILWLLVVASINVNWVNLIDFDSKVLYSLTDFLTLVLSVSE